MDAYLELRRLPKLPFIVKARFVSAKAECVAFLLSCYKDIDLVLFITRAKIKEAGGVVSLVA